MNGVALAIPERHGVPFGALIFSGCSEDRTTLVTDVTRVIIDNMTAQGISGVVRALYKAAFSGSSISRMYGSLVRGIGRFGSEPLAKGCPFLAISTACFGIESGREVISGTFVVTCKAGRRKRHRVLKFRMCSGRSGNA